MILVNPFQLRIFQKSSISLKDFLSCDYKSADQICWSVFYFANFYFKADIQLKLFLKQLTVSRVDLKVHRLIYDSLVSEIKCWTTLMVDLQSCYKYLNRNTPHHFTLEV